MSFKIKRRLKAIASRRAEKDWKGKRKTSFKQKVLEAIEELKAEVEVLYDSY